MTFSSHRRQTPTFRISRVRSTASTMDDVAKVADEAEDGYVVVAGEQTSGRGRAGSIWSARAGDGLLLSMLLRPEVAPVRLPLLSLATSLAVGLAIEQLADLPVQLKWPNDVLIEGRKVSGILLQSKVVGTHVDHVVAGVGVNVNGAPDLSGKLTTSIHDEISKKVDIGELFDGFLEQFREVYEAYCSGRDELWLARWRDRAYLLGNDIEIQSNGSVHSGRYTGIDKNGGLRIAMGGGRSMTMANGEIAHNLRSES